MALKRSIFLLRFLVKYISKTSIVTVLYFCHDSTISSMSCPAKVYVVPTVSVCTLTWLPLSLLQLSFNLKFPLIVLYRVYNTPKHG